ncbi:MAG: transposase [Deltaproteobacteria bacterium]|nr:transposase [Deltaproteobacteria bacterium]
MSQSVPARTVSWPLLSLRCSLRWRLYRGFVALNQEPDNDLPGSCAPKRTVRSIRAGKHGRRGAGFLETREQRDWVHRLANVLDKLPKRLQPKAKRALREIMDADRREDAASLIERFGCEYEEKYPRAVASLVRDREQLHGGLAVPLTRPHLFSHMSDQLDRLKTALADRYAIECELGAGGMAYVSIAEDLKHKRKVRVVILVISGFLLKWRGGDRLVRAPALTPARYSAVPVTCSERHPGWSRGPGRRSLSCPDSDGSDRQTP